MSDDTMIPLPGPYRLEKQEHGDLYCLLHRTGPLNSVAIAEDIPAEYARAFAEAMNAALATVPLSRADGALPFQVRVDEWVTACFGDTIRGDKIERNHRFLEEALELVQSTGCTQSEAHQLVDYVFSRPVGDLAQEVGGVMNTLAALCNIQGVDMMRAGDIELARCWTKIEKIRAKQAAKPKHSPLPEAFASSTQPDRQYVRDTYKVEGGEPVTLTYTNWRGETAEREITPTGRMLFTSNEWHPEPQWLVEAHGARSGEVRLFALKGFGAHNEGLDGHTTLKDDGRLLRAWMKEAGCTPSMMQADRDIWKAKAEETWTDEHGTVWARGALSPKKHAIKCLFGDPDYKPLDDGQYSVTISMLEAAFAAALTPAATPSGGADVAVEEVERLEAAQRPTPDQDHVHRLWALTMSAHTKLNRHSYRFDGSEDQLAQMERLEADFRTARDTFFGYVGILFLTNESASEYWARQKGLFRRLASPQDHGAVRSYQTRVTEWQERITVDDPTDLAERMHRFTEEAMELTQALGQTRDEAHQLVDYVHDQDHVGEPFAEFGGAYSTMAALASVAGVNLDQAGEAELARISTPEMVAKIREKRSKRHGRGPLPGTYAPDFVPSKLGREGEGSDGWWVDGKRTAANPCRSASEPCGLQKIDPYAVCEICLTDPAPSDAPRQDGEQEVGA